MAVNDFDKDNFDRDEMIVVSQKLRLVAIVLLAFVVDYLPIINIPFLWSETFFHEISHGLAAILSGGMVLKIVLNFDGSGLCTTSGGNRFLVTFSGYAGSALWGLLLYSVANAISHSKAKLIVGLIVMMLVTTLLLWARDISTIVILAVLLIMYILPLYASIWVSVKFFIQLVGVFVMLDAIRSPLHLLDGRDLGDGASLAELTWLPEVFWVALWFVIAVGSMFLLWKISIEQDKPDLTQ